MTIEEVNKENLVEIMKPLSKMKDEIKYLKFKNNIENFLSDTREKILKVSDKIKFEEKEHRYFYEGTECISVSNVVDFFCEFQDFDKITQTYAQRRNLSDWRVVREKWKLKGTIASTQGTWVHQYGEDLNNLLNNYPISDSIKNFALQEDYLIPLHPKASAIYKYFIWLINNKEIPFIAEIKLILPEYGITGTFDQLVYSTKEKGFIIRDYKTNETLTKDFKKPMLPPFEGFNDEALSHYEIQQNLYSLMLRNIGIKVLRKELVWVKDNETFQLIPLHNIEDKLYEAIGRI